MDTTKTIAALFDFDGVIMDTELQYTIFWNAQGPTGGISADADL